MSEVKPYLVTMKNDFDPNKPKYMLLIISAYNAKDAVQQAKIERKKFDKHHTYIGVKFKWVYENSSSVYFGFRWVFSALCLR